MIETIRLILLDHFRKLSFSFTYIRAAQTEWNYAAILKTLTIELKIVISWKDLTFYNEQHINNFIILFSAGKKGMGDQEKSNLFPLQTLSGEPYSDSPESRNMQAIHSEKIASELQRKAIKSILMQEVILWNRGQVKVIPYKAISQSWSRRGHAIKSGRPVDFPAVWFSSPCAATYWTQKF